MQGFTLIELAVVLVIVGLVIGGVLVGQDLIRSAENTKMVREFNRFEQAWVTFQEKYRGLPGDLTNATDFFGSAMGMRNGDGDGSISWSGSANCDAAHVFWHISLAGISNITPTNGSYPAHYARTPWRDQNMMYVYFGDLYGFPIPRRTNHLTVARYAGAGETCNAACAAYSPEVVMQIDTKLDDGLPNNGKLAGVSGYTDAGVMTTCTLGGGISYNTALGTPQCRMLYRLN